MPLVRFFLVPITGHCMWMCRFERLTLSLIFRYYLFNFSFQNVSIQCFFPFAICFFFFLPQLNFVFVEVWILGLYCFPLSLFRNSDNRIVCTLLSLCFARKYRKSTNSNVFDDCIGNNTKRRKNTVIVVSVSCLIVSFMTIVYLFNRKKKKEKRF